MTPQLPHLLITAGPTHEPIDAVRYIGNRSSGKLGVAIAEAAVQRQWPTTLLLGPTHLKPNHAAIQLQRYETSTQLSEHLIAHQPGCDILIMAAAVADYRPITDSQTLSTKLRRDPSCDMTIRLEPTEDLLCAASQRRLPHQTLVGFALEPAESLLASARQKLERKHIDLIVANELTTMESDSIRAVLIDSMGRHTSTPGTMSKTEFAPWLLDHIIALHRQRTCSA